MEKEKNIMIIVNYYLKVNEKIIRKMDMEYFIMRMGQDMKVNSKMIRNMDME